jgi:hypothetical protein
MSEPKTSVPKFGSFKPRTVPSVSAQIEEKKPTSSGKDESRTRKGGKHHHRRGRSRSRELERRHKPAATEVPLQPIEKGVPLEIFVVDRKGDVKNLEYGSVHRYSVPPFRRSGAGSVLGVPTLKIDRNYGDEKGLVLSSRANSKSNSREKYIFSKLEKERPRLVRIRSSVMAVPVVNHELDFIPIKMRSRKRKWGDSGDSNSDHDEADYRSIHRKAKAHDQPMDDDLRYTLESDTSDSENGYAMKPDVLTREKTMKLSRRVEEYPQDVDAWLALIEHQDTLVRAGDDRKRITNAEIQSTAEIKIHMYEKALEKATSLSDRERLLSGLMSEGSKVWEIKTQSDRWEKISKDNIDSLMLWKSYMSFKQTTFATFRYEEVRDVYFKRMKLLSETILSAGSNRDKSLDHQLLYVLLRFTIYIRESGYSELAIAIWQSLLEFNLFAPDLVLPQDKVDLFKEFWESEVPRIGETGALGWSNFVANNASLNPPNPVIDEEAEDLSDDRHLFSSWARSERLRQKASHLPARTMDEVVEDDPFRVILASDVEAFLVSLDPSSESLRTSFINAFLLFCCLPPVGTIDSAALEDWLSDQFIEGDHLKQAPSNTKKISSLTPHELDVGIEVSISSIFDTPTPRLVPSPESRFDPSWFRSFESWDKRFPGDNGPVSYKFVKTALQRLTKAFSREDLSEYYLAFEWQNEPDTVKKAAKGLLKQHPSSLKLYNAYGMIEWARGNKEVANSVFSAALDMSKSMPEWDRKNAILLWKSWIWASLEDMDNSTATRRLLSTAEVSLVGKVELSPATLLRARQHLLSNREHFLSAGDTLYAIDYAECLALLEYLSSTSNTETQSKNQGNISAALDSCSNFSQILITRELASGTPHELFLQFAARLLYHHARIGPFRPALLRQHLTNFISLFPQNSIFLSLYAFNESRFRVENRVRSILMSTVLTPWNDILTSRIFTINYEMRHGTVHSVRSAFEHAVSSPVSKSSVGIWKLYLLYCLETPQFVPHIKHVWYRALRACPWAKELYTLGFERFEGLVEFGELKGTWRVMSEKELRVHVDLEDKFYGMRETVKDNEPGGVKKLALK